jgi:hypothetical protein
LAVVGVKRGAKLGTIRVRNGYARVAKRVPKKYLDLRRLARARKGVPIGAERADPDWRRADRARDDGRRRE